MIATKKIIVNECHDYSDKALTRSLRSIIGREPIDVVIVDWLQMIESEPAKFEEGEGGVVSVAKCHAIDGMK